MIPSGFQKTWILLILFFPLAGLSQIKVSSLNDSVLQLHKDGLSYCLPRSRLIIDVTLSKTTHFKGPYHEYAREFLGIENTIDKNSVEYNMVAVRVDLVQEPDPAQLYRVERQGKFPFFSKRAPQLELSREGFLISINWNEECAKAAEDRNNARNFGMDSKFDKGNRKQVLLYQIDNTMLGKKEKGLPTIDTVFPPPPPRPVFKMETKETPTVDKAKEALENLARIKENRQNLASGYQEVNYENGTIRLMIEQLKDMEEGLLEMFTGTSREEIINFSLSYLPLPGDTNQITLAYLSKQDGIIPDYSENALPITLQLSPSINFPNWKVESMTKKKSPQGLVYRIPNMSQCLVKVGNDKVYTGQLIINQFGKTARLSSCTDKVQLYPETGGLRCIK